MVKIHRNSSIGIERGGLFLHYTTPLIPQWFSWFYLFLCRIDRCRLKSQRPCARCVFQPRSPAVLRVPAPVLTSTSPRRWTPYRRAGPSWWRCAACWCWPWRTRYLTTYTSLLGLFSCGYDLIWKQNYNLPCCN